MWGSGDGPQFLPGSSCGPGLEEPQVRAVRVMEAAPPCKGVGAAGGAGAALPRPGWPWRGQCEPRGAWSGPERRRAAAAPAAMEKVSGAGRWTGGSRKKPRGAQRPGWRGLCAGTGSGGGAAVLRRAAVSGGGCQRPRWGLRGSAVALGAGVTVCPTGTAALCGMLGTVVLGYRACGWPLWLRRACRELKS